MEAHRNAPTSGSVDGNLNGPPDGVQSKTERERKKPSASVSARCSLCSMLVSSRSRSKYFSNFGSQKRWHVTSRHLDEPLLQCRHCELNYCRGNQIGWMREHVMTVHSAVEPLTEHFHNRLEEFTPLIVELTSKCFGKAAELETTNRPAGFRLSSSYLSVS